jgi:cell division protein FtsB
MIVRKRFRAVVAPLLIYAVSGSAAAYFVWSAQNGPRGLKTKAEYARQMQELTGDLAAMRAEKERLRQRVALLQPPAIDRDILDEEARVLLDRVDRRDVVIFDAR